jgi:hypothetical protein
VNILIGHYNIISGEGTIQGTTGAGIDRQTQVFCRIDGLEVTSPLSPSSIHGERITFKCCPVMMSNDDFIMMTRPAYTKLMMLAWPAFNAGPPAYKELMNAGPPARMLARPTQRARPLA